MKLRKESGGTLIELLILILIQGILFTCLHFQNVSKERALTRKIVRAVGSIRNFSYKDSTQYTIEKERGRLLLKRKGGTFLSFPTKKHGVSLSPAKITFYGTGSNSPGRIIIAGRQRCRVSISLRGRVTSICGN